MSEPPRNLYSRSQIASLATLIRERAATLGRSRLVCIDGPAGSGKTTLAVSLERVLTRPGCREVTTLHMDDLYEGWSGLEPNRALEARVLNQVLRPLADGRCARWQRYDWVARQWADWHDLMVPDVLVLEGCGSGAVAYEALMTALVWVEAERDTRVARGLHRDGKSALPHWLLWMESEARHFAANSTRERSDVVLWTG